MSMNSYLNSDWKQCTKSKLGWVHSAHTQSPGRAHTARAVPKSWALLRVQRPCRAHSQRKPRVQRAQVTRIAPRSWAHVATSLPCPVLPPRSRRHFDVATSWRPSHVATSHWCRDTVSPAQHQARSRLHFEVATSWTTNLCRDVNPMSRHPKD